MSHTLKRLTPTAPHKLIFAFKAKGLDQDPDTTQSEANSAQVNQGIQVLLVVLHTVLQVLRMGVTHGVMHGVTGVMCENSIFQGLHSSYMVIQLRKTIRKTIPKHINRKQSPFSLTNFDW